MSAKFEVGDRVLVSAHGTQKEGRITLASPNGRSLLVEFDGGLFWPSAHGAYAGVMPVLQDEAGAFTELLNQCPIQIEPAQKGGQE